MRTGNDGGEGIAVGSRGQRHGGEVPNARLRMAREAVPSALLSGEPMSRAELADAVNAHLWHATGRHYALDAHTLARYERGTIRWPTAAYRSALRAVLQVMSDDQLGFRQPDRSTPASATPRPPRTVRVTSHQFVPMIIRPELDVDALGLQACEILGIEGVRGRVPHPTASADLCVFPWGVAVLHLTESLCADDLVSVATWRRSSYSASRVFAATTNVRLLGGRAAAPAYVMSTYWVDEPMWDASELDAAMRLLCMLRVLLPAGARAGEEHLAQARTLERRLLRDGFQHDGIVAFGVDGLSVGHASWAGVSYCPLVPENALRAQHLIDLEILVQALWTVCRGVREQVEAHADPTLADGYGWRWLRGVQSRLTAPRPTENSQHAALREAVLRTSGLPTDLADALDALRDPLVGRR